MSAAQGCLWAAALLLCSGIAAAATLRTHVESSGSILADDDSGDISNLTIPADFLFGAGSSNYQIEGAWNVSDKGESVLDYGYHKRGTANNGDVAADAYHHVAEDIGLMKKLKLDVYRFSISWPRLLPKGTPDIVSVDGLRFYNEIINTLLENGIQPLITLHHFDSPQAFEEEFESWMSPKMIDVFVDYAEKCFDLFGDRVKLWTTINEANMYCNMVYQSGLTPPGKGMGTGSSARYATCMHNMQVAHARTYRLYQTKYKAKQNGIVGFGCLSAENNCVAPVVLGNYSSTFSDQVPFTTEERAILKDSTDYIALNIYGGDGFGPPAGEGGPPGGGGGPPGGDGGPPGGGGMDGGDSTGDFGPPGGGNPPPMGDGMLTTLQDLHTTYKLPIFVTENGLETVGSGVNDTSRSTYCRKQLAHIMTAINVYHVKVLGYTMWNFLDDFEFTRGYSSEYGMVHVDFNSPKRTRTLKESSKFFIEFQTRREVPSDPSSSTSVEGNVLLCVGICMSFFYNYIWLK